MLRLLLLLSFLARCHIYLICYIYMYIYIYIYLVVYLLSMNSEDIAFTLLVKSHLFLLDIQPARWRSCPGRSAAWYDLSEANHGAGKIVATRDPEDFPSWIWWLLGDVWYFFDDFWWFFDDSWWFFWWFLLGNFWGESIGSAIESVLIVRSESLRSWIRWWVRLWWQECHG